MKTACRIFCFFWLGLLANTSFATDAGVVFFNQSKFLTVVQSNWYFNENGNSTLAKEESIVPVGQWVKHSIIRDHMTGYTFDVKDPRDHAWIKNPFVPGETFLQYLYYCDGPLYGGSLSLTPCINGLPSFTQKLDQTRLPNPGKGDHVQDCLDLHKNESGTLVDNNVIRLDYQPDGNLVLYTSAGDIPIWSSETQGNTGGKLCYEDDGDLVIYNSKGAPVWASGTENHDNTSIDFQRDCNVVMYDDDTGDPIWATYTAGCVSVSGLGRVK